MLPMPERAFFMTEPDRPMPPETLIQPSLEVEDPVRVKYREWISQNLESIYGQSVVKAVYALRLDERHVMLRETQDGNVENLFEAVYFRLIDDEEKPQFRDALGDVIVDRASKEDVNLKEFSALTLITEGINAKDVSPALVDAVISNPTIKNSEVADKVYRAVFLLAWNAYQTEGMEIAVQQQERLLDSEGFPDRWHLLNGIEALVLFDPQNADRVIQKYADRIKKFKEFVKSKGEKWTGSYDLNVKRISRQRETPEETPALSSESLAILQI